MHNSGAGQRFSKLCAGVTVVSRGSGEQCGRVLPLTLPSAARGCSAKFPSMCHCHMRGLMQITGGLSQRAHLPCISEPDRAWLDMRRHWDDFHSQANNSPLLDLLVKSHVMEVDVHEDPEDCS